MGKISSAMKRVPRALKNLGKITDDVGEAAGRTERALARADRGGVHAGRRVDGVAARRTAPTPARSTTHGRATLGSSTSTNYQRTFFQAHPQTEGSVVVHHAVEQQALKRYPGVVTESQMHSLENLRGIPKGDVNNRIHLSSIRKEWNRFYKANPNPSQKDLLDFVTKIDDKYGHLFNPPIR